MDINHLTDLEFHGDQCTNISGKELQRQLIVDRLNCIRKAMLYNG